nr:hypothetical protein [Scytolyngbya sp. HA4215-MV1]
KKNNFQQPPSSKQPSQPSQSSQSRVSAVTPSITDSSQSITLPKKTHAIDPATWRWRSDDDEFWGRFPGSYDQPLVTRKNRALQLRNELLKCSQLSELNAVKARWAISDELGNNDGGETWCSLIYNRVLTTQERSRINFVATVKQPTAFDPAEDLDDDDAYVF